MLVEGIPPSSIADRLPSEGALSARNVSDHFRNRHVPVIDAGVEMHTEQVAARDGAAVAAGAEAVASHLDFARVVIGKVAERLTSGAAVPTVKDGLVALRMLTELAPEPAMNMDRISRGFLEYLRAVEAEVTYDQFQGILNRIHNSPTIRYLRAAAEKTLSL